MIGLTRLVKPVLKAVQGGKRPVKFISPKKLSVSSYARPSARSRPLRYYSTPSVPSEAQDSGIVTVDKWGVQRDAKEGNAEAPRPSSSSTARTTTISGAPATEMPIFELSRMNFQESLSSMTPVIVMAYLPSSELSMQLDQKLTEKVMQYDGALRLGRLNASVEQELAVALKLTQLPTVIGVYGGRTVASFVGVPEDKTIEQFVEMLLRVGGQQELSEKLKSASHALESGDSSAAMALYNDILQNSHLKAEAIALAGMVRCAIKEGKLDDAKELLQVIQDSYPHDMNAPEVLQAQSAYDLASAGSKVDFAALEEAVKTNPDNLEAKYDLATSLWAHAKQEQAIALILDIVKRDKQWNEQAARKFLVKCWESLGPDHPLTLSSRRRFGSLWF